MEYRVGYKLFRLRKDGTLGPLFINRKQVIETGKWLKAEAHRTKGYAFRPGWHITHAPFAPHLKKDGRVWYKVEFVNYEEYKRPKSQGGLWFVAQWMKVVEKYSKE
jgi:hypothetical protein